MNTSDSFTSFTQLTQPTQLTPFLALARIALGSTDAQRMRNWEKPLAQLLAAAAQGIAYLPAQELIGDRAPDNIPSELISIENGKAMLPRIAAAWKDIRDWVENCWQSRITLADEHSIQQELHAILPAHTDTDDDGTVIFDNAQQRLAVATFIDSYFGVVTGGPGTGKTTTAAALLALRKRLDPDLRAQDVLVCAPTGKASSRLQQSLRSASTRLNLHTAETEFLHDIHAVTLHRALGWTIKAPEDGGPFLHTRHKPLNYKIILIDEASMCDIELMAQLVRALPQSCSVLLLGDREQLDSVEAGGVLAELVMRGAAGSLHPELCAQLAQRCHSDSEKIIHWREQGLPSEHTIHSEHTTHPATIHSPLAGSVIGLFYSWRARNAPWVLALAECIRPSAQCSMEALHACCAQYNAPEKITRYTNTRELLARCRHYWQQGIQQCHSWNSLNVDTLPDSETLSTVLGTFQLLCATNQQVQHANRIGSELAWGTAVQAAQAAHTNNNIAHGSPIIIESNMHQLGLSNGDIGIAIGSGPQQCAHWALFPHHQQPIALAQLPQYRPAFALTIHKSQGSEWKNIAIKLPTSGSELLDRNLLYTAITRSSGSVGLCASDDILRALIE